MSDKSSADTAGSLAALEREVAIALCQQALAGGSWPNKDVVDRAAKEWRRHLPAARAAIRTIGAAFIKGVGND